MGWIGLAVSIQRRIWYESQHDLFHEIGGEAVLDVLEYWFDAGVVMVVLDTFRRKTDTELGFWAIAAIAFGVSVLFRAADSLMRMSDTLWPGATGSLLIDVISVSIWIPAALIWVGTMFLGTLTYTVHLTRRSVCYWRTYLRST